MITTTTDIHALALRLASAKKPCPRADDHAYLDGMNGEMEDGAICSECSELGGKVYVLGPEIRVKCLPTDSYDDLIEHKHLKEDANYITGCCGSRGWNPEDPYRLGRWMVALAVIPGFSIRDFYYSRSSDKWVCVVYFNEYYRSRFVDPEAALFTAACQALGLE